MTSGSTISRDSSPKRCSICSTRESIIVPHSIRAVVSSCLLTLLFAAGAQAATSTEIVASLNALRAANGLPSDVRERADWSAGCRAHDDYQALYGLTHDEDPSFPGYTTLGNFTGSNGVVAPEASWGP